MLGPCLAGVLAVGLGVAAHQLVRQLDGREVGARITRHPAGRREVRAVAL